MTLQNKQRWITEPDVRWHRELRDSERMLSSLADALTIMVASMPREDKSEDAAANMHRIEGAKTLLQHWLDLSEPERTSVRVDYDNLKHQ